VLGGQSTPPHSWCLTRRPVAYRPPTRASVSCVPLSGVSRRSTTTDLFMYLCKRNLSTYVLRYVLVIMLVHRPPIGTSLRYAPRFRFSRLHTYVYVYLSFHVSIYLHISLCCKNFFWNNTQAADTHLCELRASLYWRTSICLHIFVRICSLAYLPKKNRFFFPNLSCHTTHTTTAERRAEQIYPKTMYAHRPTTSTSVSCAPRSGVSRLHIYVSVYVSFHGNKETKL